MTTSIQPLPNSETPSQSAKVVSWKDRTLENDSVRFLVLLVVFSFLAIKYLRDFYMSDPDFGWHLRAGQWIWANHGVPRTDPFSVYGADKYWCDYSWLFDILFAQLYRAFGLMGLAFVEVAARVAIPALIYRLSRKLNPSFWLAATTTVMAAYSMSSIYAPRPGMFTVAFFAIEMELLFGALLDGKFSRLFWLPPLFLLWACIHIQFVHGLIVLAMFAGEPILNSILRYKPETPPLPLKSVRIFVGSVLATLLTPYGWHLYSTVFVYAGQKNIYSSISEMIAMSFREPYHYVLLFLVLGAALAMGWSRKLRPLYIGLFAFACLVGFRSIKDVWLVAIVSVALIAASLREAKEEAPSVSGFSLKNRLALAVCVLAMIAVACRRYDVSNSWIDLGIAGRYPEAAVRYVERNHLEGPLYNDFTSGGFLIWRLPGIRVSMDGRTNVHGDERVKTYSDSLRGLPGWEKDPDLAAAKLIIWPTKSPLIGLLRCDSRFQQVFSDPQATVLVRR
jgi:hypothetical protein